MFSTEKEIDNIKKLLSECKQYVELQKKFLKLDLTEKATVLLSAIVIISVIILLVAMILLYFAFAAAYYLGNITQSLPLGFAIVGGSIILILILFYLLRDKIVVQPLAKLFVKLFIENTSSNDRQQQP